uniref:SLBB domain-containing protein n=1 Tax=Heterorhabditis bacteriophora TaxID=37862 RepID=A0A1I7X2W1_HETBA
MGDVALMLYVRKREDQIYTPLHVIPPTLGGLAQAVGAKFGIESEKYQSASG